MTTNEFLNLKKLTKVNLPFSINPDQYVVDIDIMEETITTRPYDDDLVTYVNDYRVVELA